MALGFFACTAPDSHISYLQSHQGLIHFYLDGITPPDSEMSSPLPEWWPQQSPKLLNSWNINHRNTDLYHWILNGAPDLVTSEGSIFQTGYEPDYSTSVVKLDKYNERFAFHRDKIDKLASLVDAVNTKSVLSAFTEWCKIKGKTWEDLDEYACEPFVEEFGAFGDLLSEAKRKEHGIIW